MSWRRGLLVGLACLACINYPLAAQMPQDAVPNAGMEQRLQELEAQVRQLQNDKAKPSESTEPLSETDSGDGGPSSKLFPIAGWEEGFFIQSPDKSYVLRFTGQIQGDYRAFLRDEDTTDIDTFLLRRARIGVEATMAKYYEFRFLMDFGQGNPRIQDGYFNFHYWDEIQLKVGKFKQPTGYEEYFIQDRFVPTVERSMIDQITPARDVGIMLHGTNLFEDRIEWGVSLSNGQINGDGDNNQFSDFNARLAVKPFNSPGMPDWLRRLEVGVSGGFGNETEPISPSTYKTPATVPWFQFNSTALANGVRTRLDPELVYYYGPLGFAAQYMQQEQEIRAGSTPATFKYLNNVGTRGFYVMASYLVTGEDRITYDMPLQPLAPFDPRTPFAAPGAWEPIVRVSRLEVDRDVFVTGPARLADPAKWSPGATELTAGFNWYLNKWVRIQFNWEHAWFDEPVQLGVGAAGRLRQQDSLLTRFQIIF